MLNLHPLPSSSTQLISGSQRSLQHAQRYKNQNIACNCAMSSNIGWKIQICPFGLKISIFGMFEVVIPNPDLDFGNSDPKSIFGQIWAEKVKVVRFTWKLEHMVSQGCWFFYWHKFYEFLTLNPLLENFGLKKSKLSVLPEGWHTEYLEDADSYSSINLLNFQP